MIMSMMKHSYAWAINLLKFEISLNIKGIVNLIYNEIEYQCWVVSLYFKFNVKALAPNKRISEAFTVFRNVDCRF